MNRGPHYSEPTDKAPTAAPPVTLDQIASLFDERLDGLATVEMVDKKLNALETKFNSELAKRPTETGVVKIVQAQFTEMAKTLTSFREEFMGAINGIRVDVAKVSSMKPMLADVLETQRFSDKERDSLKAETVTQAGEIQALDLAIFGDATKASGNVPLFQQLSDMRNDVSLRFDDIKADAQQHMKALSDSTTLGFRTLTGLYNRQVEGQTMLVARVDAIEKQIGYWRNKVKAGAIWLKDILSTKQGKGAGATGIGALIIYILTELSRGL